MNPNVRLSVDLGTTWTAAAVATSGEPESVPLGTNGAAMQSVVAVVDGRIVSGNAAVRAATVDPASSAREFKRRLGDTAPIVLGGTPYGAETLMGHLLAHVVGVVTESVGAPSAVTLTHPAVFGEYKLDLLREAARVAGLGSVTLLSEPEAAALHYARLGRLAVGDTVAVYDFGGGTFDAAVVRLGADGPQLLGRPEGLERLGGIDLDHAVLAHVDASLDGALSQLDTSNPDVRRAVLALRQECIDAKETLSVDTEVSVNVTVPGLDTVVRVTRGEFESFVRPRLGETLGALDRAIGSAGLAVGDLAGVVLVGGSSRIPLVVEQVGAHTGRPLLTDADPKLVVVLGAVPVSDRPAAHQEDAMSTTTPPAAGGEPAAPGNAAPAKDAPTGDGAKDAVAAPGAKEHRTNPSQREPEKGGMSTAGKVAAGVAAVGLAGATAAFWRDDVENAVGLGDDDDPDAPPQVGGDEAAVAAAQAVPEVAEATPVAVEADESMDAFDAIADAPAPSGFAARSGGGGGGGGAPAPARQAPARNEEADIAAPAGFAATTNAPPRGAPAASPAPSPSAPQAPPLSGAPIGQPVASSVGTPPPVATPPPVVTAPSMPADPSSAMPTDAAFAEARVQLEQRLEAWQPPEGADPAEVAELRARLDGLLDRYEPRPGQSVDDAIADLRDQFELRIDNFTQDQKIDALVEEAAAGGAMPAPDPAFEDRRDALRESLTNWQAPEGTSPEDAAELKAQLEALVDSYQPRPGQTADQALMSLRAEFDDQVHDFTQDQKIDALVEELQEVRAGDGMTPPDPEFESRRDALSDSLASWEAPEGTSPEDAAALKAELQTLVGSYQPAPGQTADEAIAALRSQFDDQVQDFTQDQKIDALVEEQQRDNATVEDGGMNAAVEPDGGAAIDPRVSMPADLLTDDFDDLIADPTPGGDMGLPGFAIGEPTPGRPVAAPGDEDFSAPDHSVGDVLGLDLDLGAMADSGISDPDGLVVDPVDHTAGVFSGLDDVFGVDDLVDPSGDAMPEVGDFIADPIPTGEGLNLPPLLDENGEPVDLIADTPEELAAAAAARLDGSIDDYDLLTDLPEDSTAPGLGVPPMDDLDNDLDGGMTAEQMDDPLSGI